MKNWLKKLSNTALLNSNTPTSVKFDILAVATIISIIPNFILGLLFDTEVVTIFVCQVTICAVFIVLSEITEEK